MAGLQKSFLIRKIQHAVKASGLSYQSHSQPKEHPYRFSLLGSDTNIDVIAYIWTVTHGGRGRSAEEYRIQVTGIDKFEINDNSTTAILGYYPDFELFVAYDPAAHKEGLGKSPSMQVSIECLNEASNHQFSLYKNAKEETVVVFSPDILSHYLINQAALHDSGNIENGIETLNSISDMTEEETTMALKDLPPERQYAISQTRRAVRDASFRSRVLAAYGNACAVCSLQLGMIQAAHIYPASQPDSTDETSNGIALCGNHHKAYDDALITFDEGYNLLKNDQALQGLADSNLSGGQDNLLDSMPEKINIPGDEANRPNLDYIKIANKVRGW